MHLGRFHATVYDLASHFKTAKTATHLEQIAAVLDQIQSNATEELIKDYRERIERVKESAAITDLDLEKPYAQQIIDELNIRDLINPAFSKELDAVTQSNTFGASATAVKLREFSSKYKKRVEQLVSIDQAFSFYDVEFERVSDGESEIGMLLPREIVGDSLPDLAKEFSKFGNLFAQVNELTGAADYNPRIRTISSSWWQFFVELDPAQISAWIEVTSGLVGLWTLILELKKAKHDLEEKKVSEGILEALEDEIQRKIELGIADVVDKLRSEHSKVVDTGRENELKVGITQGLKHMAKRMAQGGLVQIDVSLPEEPIVPDEPIGPELERQIQEKREHIAALRKLRLEGMATSQRASQLTSSIDDVKLLSNVVSEDGDYREPRFGDSPNN